METSIYPQAITDTQPIATTKCSKCGRELPVTDFSKSSKAKSGLQSWCKHCSNENNKRLYQEKISKNTPPQSVTESHPIYSKMQPREIQAEIRERVNYLRSIGWNCEVKLTYTQVKEVTI